jgi:RNA polymerase primary sigma factor
VSELLDPTHDDLSAEVSRDSRTPLGREEIGQLQARAHSEPPLSAAEEQRLARLAELGDVKARERLVNAHLWLVTHIAREHARNRGDLPDLVQEGLVGLLRAVDRFDWRRGNRLSTYAAFWIRQAMLRSTQGLIRVPEHRREQSWAVARARQRLTSELGREPSVAELAAVTGAAEHAVELALEGAPSTVSFEGDGRKTADAAPLDERLPSEDDIEAEIELRERRQALGAALASLPDRLRAMLQLRYGLDGERPLSLAEAGSRLGLNRHQAYRLEAAGLERLSRDGGLRQAVGKLPQRLRSLFPFGLGAPWAALKGAFSADAGVKAAAALVVVGGATAISAWQHLGPFGPEAPSRPGPVSQGARPGPTEAAAPVPPSPTPPASARQRLGKAPETPGRRHAKPPRPQAQQAPVAAASASQESSRAPTPAEPPDAGSSRPPAAGKPPRQEQPQGTQSGGLGQAPGDVVDSVKGVVSSLPLPPPVDQVADAAITTVEAVVDSLPPLPEVTLPDVPSGGSPDVGGTLDDAGSGAGGLLDR